MRREIRSEVTEEEYAEVVAYVKAKKRWRNVSAFVRDCVFKVIVQNPVGRHGGASTSEQGGE